LLIVTLKNRNDVNLSSLFTISKTSIIQVALLVLLQETFFTNGINKKTPVMDWCFSALAQLGEYRKR
jgi:hypothetical protein